MIREEAIKHLTDLLPNYEPEIYAKDTLHKRQAIQFAIAVLSTEDTNKITQRQDSTNDQLRDVMIVANKMGCYDAADVISNILNGVEEK